MPTIDLPDDELTAVTAAIRGVIAGDRYPHAPRLDPLRAALGKMEATMADRKSSGKVSHPKPTPEPKAPPDGSPKEPSPAKADKRARSAKATEPTISPGFKLGRLPPDR